MKERDVPTWYLPIVMRQVYEPTIVKVVIHWPWFCMGRECCGSFPSHSHSLPPSLSLSLFLSIRERYLSARGRLQVPSWPLTSLHSVAMQAGITHNFTAHSVLSLARVAGQAEQARPTNVHVVSMPSQSEVHVCIYLSEIVRPPSLAVLCSKTVFINNFSFQRKLLQKADLRFFKQYGHWKIRNITGYHAAIRQMLVAIWALRFASISNIHPVSALGHYAQRGSALTLPNLQAALLNQSCANWLKYQQYLYRVKRGKSINYM